MKILVLNYEYPPLGGGGSKVSEELCEQCGNRGISIDIVTMGYKELPQKEKRGNIVIHRVKCWRSKQRVCHPWEQLSYCINAYRYIGKHLDVGKYDFVHCHFIIPTGLLALWLKKKYGLKYMITSHGSDVLGHNDARFLLLYKLIAPGWKKILANASAITAPSEYLVNKIHETMPDILVDIIANGIHCKDYRPGNKKKTVIAMTRLQESKGVQDLIEACAAIDMHEWTVVILGDGPYRPNLEALVKQKGLENKIRFGGHVTGDERMKYLSEAGCFFSGSRFEAFSLSVLEASLCGCNVIASKIEPHIMLVGQEHTYEVVDELKSILSSVVSGEPEAVEYGNEKYDWENIYEKYETLYRGMS